MPERQGSQLGLQVIQQPQDFTGGIFLMQQVKAAILQQLGVAVNAQGVSQTQHLAQRIAQFRRQAAWRNRNVTNA